MPGDKYGTQYLQSLLRSNPGTSEELLQAQQKIDLYFRSLEKTQKRESVKPSAQNLKPGAKAAKSPISSTKARIQNNSKPKGQSGRTGARYSSRVAFIYFLFLVMPFFIVLCMHTAFAPLPFCVLIILGLLIWTKKTKYLATFTGIQDQEQIILQQKSTDLERFIQQILQTKDLASALGPAEECLGILNYCDQLRHKHTLLPANEKHVHSTQIDPLNTLIERLIEDHQLAWADKLSQHYLNLITPEY